jgi:hypothetical protein
MLTVLSRLILLKKKDNKFCFYLPVLAVLHILEHSKTGKVTCVVGQRQLATRC